MMYFSNFRIDRQSNPAEGRKAPIHRHDDTGDEGGGRRDQPEQRAKQVSRGAKTAHRGMGNNGLSTRQRVLRWPRSVSRKRFCSVSRKLGAMALTRIKGLYSCAMCTASHWVKLLTPALAAE